MIRSLLALGPLGTTEMIIVGVAVLGLVLVVVVVKRS
jgi:hypothetical protein